MSTRFAIVQTGGKQYVVKKGDRIVVERLHEEEQKQIKLATLAIFDTEKSEVELGYPRLTKQIAATILAHDKGEKIRVAKFKSKVRYRKVRGFRPSLTQLEIGAI